MGLKIVTLRVKIPAVLYRFAVSRLAAIEVSAEPAIEFALDILLPVSLKFTSHQGVIKSTGKIPVSRAAMRGPFCIVCVMGLGLDCHINLILMFSIRGMRLRGSHLI
jgi:hypothetical protein